MPGADRGVPKAGVVDEDAGIVNMPELLPEIIAEGLDELNGFNDQPENVSSGYHAVEFLLWGQALEDVGPGERPATDYAIAGPRTTWARATATRRAASASV